MDKKIDDNITTKISLLIASIEKNLKLHVTINDYTGIFYRHIPITNSFHCNLACKEIKKSPDNNELCRIFDTLDVPQLLKKEKRLNIKRCFFNLFEFIYPISDGDVLLGTIFWGPFTIKKSNNLSFFNQVKSSDINNEAKNFIYCQVPSFYADEIDGLKILADILLSKLSELLIESNKGIEDTSKMTRKDNISRYLSMNFSKKIHLSDLAKHLALSESRTSYILHTELSESFASLLNKYRIEHAKTLLINTDFTTYDISDRCGFSDISYFHQVFKKLTGTTPNRFRMKHGSSQISNNYDNT